jgi:CheY-like chemotaxis protein
MPERAIILLVEDDDNYVRLIKDAFSKANIPNPLFVVWNGEEAIWYLEGKGKYANRDEYPLPDLVLLDIRMPRVDGFEVIKWIRRQPGLVALRVLMLTSSEEIREVNEAYRLGANSFMVKPNDFEDTKALGRLISDFWLKASRSPETYRPPKKRNGNGPNQPSNGGEKQK